MLSVTWVDTALLYHIEESRCFGNLFPKQRIHTPTALTINAASSLESPIQTPYRKPSTSTHVEGENRPTFDFNCHCKVATFSKRSLGKSVISND